VVDYCKTLMDIVRKESCGKCILCREGAWQVYEILRGITDGQAQSGDMELMTELLEHMRSNAGCELSQEAAWRSLELMKATAEEWDLHIRRKRCTNLICRSAYTLSVDPSLCDGCGACAASCQAGAIAGSDGLIHVIRTEKCKQTLACMKVCPKGAIKKAGPVKPKIPVEPVPVGSFGECAGEGEETTRRRRRKS
jgi:NADH-quinone oxidoreductase subunit F